MDDAPGGRGSGEGGTRPPDAGTRRGREGERVDTVTRSEGLSPPPGEEAGLDTDRIGPYCIIDTLGEGGMGAVYLAEQTEPIPGPFAGVLQ